MTPDEIRAALFATERALSARTEICRIVIDKHGHELHRVYRGSFKRGTEPRKEDS